jgi:3-hydroxyisobutyrate dehydrogenase-like beta-hydroxyacid dehydrogenase
VSGPPARHVRVGMVGLGGMGYPIAARVRAAGYPLAFHARRPEVIAQATTLGAVDARSLRGVGEASDVVIVCVFNDEQVVDVCLADDGLLAAMAPGSTLVNHTTGSPTTAGMLAEAAGPRGARVLDAALSGGPADIAKGELTLLIGGDPGVLGDVAPVLATYASPILHVGRVGDGQRVKLVNNAIFAANVALVAEAERVAAGLGVSPEAALDAITHCSGDSYALRTTVALRSAVRVEELAGKYMKKDTATVARVAGELGVDLGLLGVVASSPRWGT